MFLFVFLIVSLPAWAYRIGPRRPRLSAWIGLVGGAALPFVLPPDDGATASVLRMLAAAWAVIFAAKSWERAHDNLLHRRVLDSWRSFCVWWFIPLDSRPVADSEIGVVRAKAARRVARAIPKLAVGASFIALNGSLQLDWTTPYLTAAWSMVLLYTIIAGIADLVTGTAMLAGYEVAEPFRAPMLARSPRDFWSRRWNRFVSEFARRNIYWRRGGRANPTRAALLVFSMSGLMHEYLIVALESGLGRYTGWSMAFFALHGVVFVLDARLRWFDRMPQPVAIACHLLLLWVTSPLFFIPLDEATGFTRW